MKYYSLLFMFIVFNSFSQTEWTLRQCVDTALLKSTSIQSKNITLEQKEIRQNNFKYEILPSINGSATHGYNWGQTIDPFTNTFATNRVQYNNFYLNSSVILFSGLEKYYTKKILATDYRSQQLNLEIEFRNKTIDIITSYLEISLNSELVNIARKQVIFSENQQKRIKDLILAERETSTEILKINAQLSNDKFLSISAENNLRLSLLKLQQQIGLKYDSLFQISESKIHSVKKGTPTELEDKYNQMMYQKQFYELRQIRGQYFPKLILNGSLGSGYSENNKFADANGQFIPKPFGRQLGENFYQSVSATLSIPIFNGNRTRSQIRINELELERIQLQGAQSKIDYENNILKMKIEIKNASFLFESAKDLYNSSKIDFENNQLRYENGLLNYIDFLESKKLFFIAESKMIQAKYQLKFNEMILMFY